MVAIRSVESIISISEIWEPENQYEQLAYSHLSGRLFVEIFTDPTNRTGKGLQLFPFR